VWWIRRGELSGRVVYEMAPALLPVASTFWSVQPIFYSNVVCQSREPDRCLQRRTS
jgi:hypothetical protein